MLFRSALVVMDECEVEEQQWTWDVESFDVCAAEDGNDFVLDLDRKRFQIRSRDGERGEGQRAHLGSRLSLGLKATLLWTQVSVGYVALQISELTIAL